MVDCWRNLDAYSENMVNGYGCGRCCSRWSRWCEQRQVAEVWLTGRDRCRCRYHSNDDSGQTQSQAAKKSELLSEPSCGPRRERGLNLWRTEKVVGLIDGHRLRVSRLDVIEKQ